MEDSEDFAPDDDNDDDKVLLSDGIESYQASTSTSSTGRGISVQVSLPLPFSDDIACTRFTDLPQQSRWSPWLNSVAYLDGEGETEWTLNVRGVEFSWRAVSKILDEPKGIMWESISGIKNKGRVEFIPTSEESCLMKVKMNIITPRILASLFKNTSVLLGDFLQKKLLKWSLEMFRDVVKADLALERGDVELGDALFGAVEGRANAIEATLSD
uniref:Coenzyme Q-binding protein COQ10 START domain-containing protein n=3 Tax=Ditylum brightwellii TaxID=49249 RepID=A0A7S4S2S6_9STRA